MKQCKYCKETDHFIDKCPEIICKICKNKGHPHWRCSSKKIKFNRFEVVSVSKIKSQELKLVDFIKYQNISWEKIC